MRLIAGSLQPGRRRAVLLARDESGYAAICRLTTLRQVRPDFRLLRELPPWLGAEGGGLFCLTDSLPLLEAIGRAAREESGAERKTRPDGFHRRRAAGPAAHRRRRTGSGLPQAARAGRLGGRAPRARGRGRRRLRRLLPRTSNARN